MQFYTLVYKSGHLTDNGQVSIDLCLGAFYDNVY